MGFIKKLLSESVVMKVVNLIAIAASFSHIASAETNVEKAQLLYSRIAGVKLSYSSPLLKQISDKILQKNYAEAAELALNTDDFYNVSLFQYFAPLSTRSEANDVVLNDMIAMGIANTFVDPSTKKDRPYTQLVNGNFTVLLNGAALALNNNTALTNAYNNRIVLTPSNLTTTSPQRANFPDAAGVLTSRQFMSEHAIAGTNRRMVHFAFREFLCTDIKDWRDADTTFSDDYVTRDVNRAPGGGMAGINQYQTECRACHQMQDGLRNAFAFHDFVNGAPVYTPGTVVAKINNNVEYAGGFVVTSDAWENRAVRNANVRRFGWSGAMKGNGAKSFGDMISKSERFATCAVERVFKHVCKRSLTSSEDSLKEILARKFQVDDYSLRGLFREVALSPSCLRIGE